MGLFDKFKEAALTVAKTATDKISSVMKDEESKTKEKYADDIPIQILPTLGIVFNYSGIDTMYSYDICLDDENERIVLRKESNEGPYKYKFIVGYDYDLFKNFSILIAKNLKYPLKQQLWFTTSDYLQIILCMLISGCVAVSLMMTVRVL